MPVDSWEIDGADNLAVAERLAVAVFVVRVGFLADVADEGDRTLIRSKGRARKAKPYGCLLEGGSDPIAPGPCIRCMMDLVEDDESLGHESPERSGICSDLLIGDRNAMNVRGQRTVGGGPLGIEVDVHLFGGDRPLELEMLRGNDDHASPHLPPNQGATNRTEREGCLPGAGCCHCEKTRVDTRLEFRERFFLPGTKADGRRHDGPPRSCHCDQSRCCKYNCNNKAETQRERNKRDALGGEGATG